MNRINPLNTQKRTSNNSKQSERGHEQYQLYIKTALNLPQIYTESTAEIIHTTKCDYMPPTTRIIMRR